MIYDENIIVVDYQDDKVFYDGKAYPSGYFVIPLLNTYWENEFDIVVTPNNRGLDRLVFGFNWDQATKSAFLQARLDIFAILRYLPHYPPFPALDIETEKKRIEYLFSREHWLDIETFLNNRDEYYRLKKTVKYGDKDFDRYFKLGLQKDIYEEVLKTAKFYYQIDRDIRLADEKIHEFVRRLATIPHLDEKHMLPIAVEVWGPQPFSVTTEYVAIQKSSRSKNATIARRLYFDNFMSFIMTDLFEGLHHGHHPQRCPVCGQYFLITSARKQIYCDGMAPYELRGKRVSCRKMAAAEGRKERAAGNPVIDVYNRRCSAIRTEKNRGTITPEFAAAASKLAKEYKYRALQDEGYAQGQYIQDMTREHLYKAAEKLIV